VKPFRDRGLMDNLKAGFRVVGDDEYTPLYPEGLESFSVK
jgi:hypothetical protein